MVDFLHELNTIVSFLKGEKLPYMIFGGVANSVYGNPRQTFDIDLKIIADTQKKRENLIDKLASFSRILVDDPLRFIKETNVLPIEINGVRVDLVFASLPYEKTAIKRSRTHEMYGFEMQACSLEDLLIQKVISTREKDWLDIETLIKTNKDKIDWSYLQKHCA